jgi:tetratricopeptide (TPR) repeat protein
MLGSVLNARLNQTSELYTATVRHQKPGVLQKFGQWLTQKTKIGQWVGLQTSTQLSNDQLWYERGLQALAKRDYTMAIAYFNRVLLITPNQPDVWHSRGDALAALKDYSGALMSFDRALELQPDRYDTLVCRSSILIQLDRQPEAIASLWF